MTHGPLKPNLPILPTPCLPSSCIFNSISQLTFQVLSLSGHLWFFLFSNCPHLMTTQALLTPSLNCLPLYPHSSAIIWALEKNYSSHCHTDCFRTYKKKLTTYNKTLRGKKHFRYSWSLLCISSSPIFLLCHSQMPTLSSILYLFFPRMFLPHLYASVRNIYCGFSFLKPL